ncbi:MAG: 2,3-bisphosphoglycerate-independent phosphoglycerate mutase [Patescibacteria group bacterium]
MKKKVLLIIRDGWGFRESCEENALCDANLPTLKFLRENFPHTLISASGEAVGLPAGTMGNSEVGHITIGAGRIKFQPYLQINKAIETGEFFKNSVILSAIENCKKNNSTLHLIGLLQIEAVHSHISHLFAILDFCKKENFENVVIHIITDGRDSGVYQSLNRLSELNQKIMEVGFGKIISISGRYFAMDRDNRWERTKKSFDAIVFGKSAEKFEDAESAIKSSHEKNITDEFIEPIVQKNYFGFAENDSVIFWNFRTDRTRQLTKAIVEESFENFERGSVPKVHFVAMTEFYKPMNASVAFCDVELTNTLGEVLSKNNLTQLRISETEKYAHVTFFMNGQVEIPNLGEKRILIPSPKVATYDLKPEMSVFEIKEKLIEEIKKENYDFIVVNFVNADMVGHTAVYDAIVKAVEAVDICVGEVVKTALEENYEILVTSDHGNAEDQREIFRTSHTTHPVEFFLVSNDEKLKNAKLKQGKGLQDIAPTILELLEVEKPVEMTGESLIE